MSFFLHSQRATYMPWADAADLRWLYHLHAASWPFPKLLHRCRAPAHPQHNMLLPAAGTIVRCTAPARFGQSRNFTNICSLQRTWILQKRMLCCIRRFHTQVSC
ncbi:hypothetical protein BDV98DRAFT_437806 [Pterulicium gracile]|uniref:Uncharacterized protein n=1 Tax=Pterulicium gracile TaxID=1884261 RepID=A0A5C3QQX9_9AGAR|nr:hypothetical protein BDV98DRAFT_437806 [Pterula gracilis]